MSTAIDPPLADGATDTSPGHRPLGIAVAAVWLIGVGGVIGQLWTHGPDGRTGAAVIASMSLGILAVLRLPVLTWWQRAGGVAVLAGIGELLGVGYVGRAPMAIAAGGLLLTDAAMFPRSIPVGEDGPAMVGGPVGRPAVTPALATMTAAALCWVGSGSLVVLGGCWALCGGILLMYAVRPEWSGRPHLGVWDWCTERRNRPILGAAALMGVATAPILWRQAVDPKVFIRGTNDINSGLPRVAYIQFWPPRMSVAHPPWFVLIRILEPLWGSSVAVTLVGSLSAAATAAALMSIARSRWERLPSLPALRWPLAWAFTLGYFFLDSPALFTPRTKGVWGRFPFAGAHGRGMGYASLHQWATPTIVMGLPLSLAMFMLVLSAMDEDASEDSAKHRWSLFALTALSTLTQPAATLALVPAAALLLVVRRRVDRRSLSLVGWPFIVPGTAICLAQVWFLASDVSPLERARWLWRPFWIWPYFGGDHAAFWLLMLFFPVCWWAGGRRYFADRAVVLSGSAFLISIVPFLLLEQRTVAKMSDGDLGVPPLMAMILLFMSSLRFLLIEVQSWWDRHEAGERPRLPAWAPVAAVLLSVMFCAGVVDFLAAAGVIPET